MLSTTPDTALLAEAVAALERLRQIDFEALAGSEIPDSLIRLDRARNQLDAVFNRGVRALDKHHAYAASGSLVPDAWLHWKLRMHPSAAANQVHTARRLERLPETAERFANGEITFSHASVIARTLAGVDYPEGDAEEILLHAAGKLDAGRVGAAGRRLAAYLQPDGTLRNANEQHDRRYLQLSKTYDGVFPLQGLLDAEGGAHLKTALDAATGPPARDDNRTGDQRRADALVAIADHALNSGHLPQRGGQRPHLCVTADVAALFGESGHEASTLDMTGEPVPIEMVQRIFCDCQLTPLALGEDGNLVGVGRSKRTFTAAQRKAIARRDGGCAFPGCGRDPNWCDGHHLVPWYLGGSTEIDNGVLLCRRHHLCVHDGHWTLLRDPVTGTFDAVPP